MKSEFKVDTKIYSSAIIKQAIEDYSDFGNISFNKNTIIFDCGSEEDNKEYFLEFMNYCIGLINNT